MKAKQTSQCSLVDTFQLFTQAGHGNAHSAGVMPLATFTGNDYYEKGDCSLAGGHRR